MPQKTPKYKCKRLVNRICVGRTAEQKFKFAAWHYCRVDPGTRRFYRVSVPAFYHFNRPRTAIRKFTAGPIPADGIQRFGAESCPGGGKFCSAYCHRFPPLDIANHCPNEGKEKCHKNYECECDFLSLYTHRVEILGIGHLLTAMTGLLLVIKYIKENENETELDNIELYPPNTFKNLSAGELTPFYYLFGYDGETGGHIRFTDLIETNFIAFKKVVNKAFDLGYFKEAQDAQDVLEQLFNDVDPIVSAIKSCCKRLDEACNAAGA